MKHLFNHSAFPIVGSDKAVAWAYKQEGVKAIVYRNPAWKADNAYLAQSVQSVDSPDLAKLYHGMNNDQAARMSGKDRFEKSPNHKIIMQQAEDAGIVLDNRAVNIIHGRLIALNKLYSSVYKRVFNETSRGTYTHLMVAPKGALGRSPEMHVDNLRLTLHHAFGLAGVNVYTGSELPDEIWDAMNKEKSLKLNTEDAHASRRLLIDFVDAHEDDFVQTSPGDTVFLKGQKGLDLDLPEVRKVMPAHSSSPEIADKGQLAALIYHGRLPSLV